MTGTLRTGVGAAPDPHRPRIGGLLAATALLSLLLLLASAGCGYEESYTGLGEGAVLGDPLKPIPQNCSCECTGGGGGGESPLEVEDLAGFAYRFDTLALTAPITGPLADPINQYFTDEIAKEALHVLLVLDEDDREAGTLAARVGSGETGEAGYRLGEEASALGLELDGARFTTREPTFLRFPNGLLVPPAIPIRQLELSGVFSADVATLGKGELVGALLLEEAQGIKLGAMSFDQVLVFAGAQPDLDTDGDGTADAWTFEGSFTAARIELAP